MSRPDDIKRMMPVIEPTINKLRTKAVEALVSLMPNDPRVVSLHAMIRAYDDVLRNLKTEMQPPVPVASADTWNGIPEEDANG